MTFEEVELSLPNGLHDAEILKFALDSQERTVLMTILVHASGVHDLDKETYREIELKATGVSLFFMEPPDPTYHFLLNGEGIYTSGCSVAIGQVASVDLLLKQLPPEASAYRFFLENWNSFLYIAASDVTFSWQP
jgi:hypothetical protein